MPNSKKVIEKFSFLTPLNCENYIRLGNKCDGGYVVPADISKKTDILISFGYGYDPSFEYDYIKYTENKVQIYDYSCSFLLLFKSFLKVLKRFITFRKKFKDVLNSYQNLKKHFCFVKNKKINFQKKKVSPINAFSLKNNITVDKIFKNLNYKNVFLKCDIEGSEYLIIDDILNYHSKIDVITIEFHWVEKNLEIFIESIKKILNYYSIVHIHGNNHNPLIDSLNIPDVPEITFVNNKLIKKKKFIKNFPRLNLDYPNNKNYNDLYFHF